MRIFSHLGIYDYVVVSFILMEWCFVRDWLFFFLSEVLIFIYGDSPTVLIIYTSLNHLTHKTSSASNIID
jgi:hypothetical protein